MDSKLLPSLDACKAAFGNKLVLYSNSAGLYQYDPEGVEAEQLESDLGIPVLRHREKKPAGGCGELEDHFGCPACELIMVGDRYLTDIVFGNRHHMFTIRVAPLVDGGEPVGVALSRSVEDYLVPKWIRAGTQAPAHRFAPHGDLETYVAAPPAP